jgi:hypothetical protein
MIAQRALPAAAASIAAPAGPRRSSNGRPTKRNTITSAATDTDHSNPAVSAIWLGVAPSPSPEADAVSHVRSGSQ